MESTLAAILDYAVEKGIVENNVTEKDLFDTKLMGLMMPRPSEVEFEFFTRYNVSPEAATGGPIALVEEDDLILIDVATRALQIVGVKGEEKTAEEMERILAERKAKWVPKEPKYKDGVLALFTKLADSPMSGGKMKL